MVIVINRVDSEWNRWTIKRIHQTVKRVPWRLKIVYQRVVQRT